MLASTTLVRADIEKCWKVLETGREEGGPTEGRAGKFEEMAREIKELKAGWKWSVPPSVTKAWVGGEGRSDSSGNCQRSALSREGKYLFVGGSNGRLVQRDIASPYSCIWSEKSGRLSLRVFSPGSPLGLR